MYCPTGKNDVFPLNQTLFHQVLNSFCWRQNFILHKAVFIRTFLHKRKLRCAYGNQVISLMLKHIFFSAEFKEAIGIEFQGNIPSRAKLRVNGSEFFVSKIYID